MTIVYRNGSEFHLDDEEKFHRDDGPARVWASGNLEWFQHGTLHREDGPARVLSDGTKEWFQHGKLHREEDKPAREQSDDTMEWYQKGMRHRLMDPAVMRPDGTMEWWFENNRLPPYPFYPAAKQYEPSNNSPEGISNSNKVINS